MKSAERKDVKSTFFRTYRSLATNQPALDKLYNVWKGNRQINNLSLSTDDRINLAYELMLKHPEKRDTIKSLQVGQITNDEKRREFKFVSRALAGKQEQRDAFFRDLLEEENREKEPWVNQALHYLHHPLRAEQSIKYIEPSLKELKEIQKTGDIFFPKSWLDATLRGHSSSEAADVVRGFLEEHPDYPANLKNKILQSADMLFRAEQMHE
jgi:aminopeptidase N